MCTATRVWLDGPVTILADPRRCPSCRNELRSDAPVCPACSLDLRGEPGTALFALLSRADQMIAQIRAGSQAAAAPGPLPAVPAMPTAGQSPGVAAGTAPPRKGPRLATVPGVLLSLGALCVLVAGALFLPFAWELLGVVGRTIVLVVLTTMAGVGSYAAGSRGLRATSESLGAVALGLLALDVLGANASGWLGDVSDAGLTVTLGVVLLLAGSGATVVVRRTRTRGLLTGEGGAVLGVAVGALGLAALPDGTLGQRLALATSVALAAAAISWRIRGTEGAPRSMAMAAIGHAGVAALCWSALVLAALARLEDGLTVAALWPDGAGLELALAGALAAAPLLHRGLAQGVRAGLLSVALLPWSVAVTAASFDEGPTTRVMVAIGVLLLASAGWLALGHWRATVLPLGVVAAVTLSVLVTPLSVAAAAAASEAWSQMWAGTAGGSVASTWDISTWGPAWLLPSAVLVLFLALVVISRHWFERDGFDRDGVAVVGAPTALAVAGALLMSGSPVWSVVCWLLIWAVVASVVALRTASMVWPGAIGVLGAATIYVAAYDEVLTLASCSTLLVVAAVEHRRGRPVLSAVSGGFIVPLLAGATWAGATRLGWPEVWTALTVLLLSAAVVIARGAVGSLRGILGVEVGAVAASVASMALGIEAAGFERESQWLAGYLTVLGVATTAVALLRPDRRRIAWAGGLLLAMASWVRLEDLGVATVEAYTLPSALVLLAVGWWHTARHEESTTLAAWSPGLGLALIPSLLWSLDDPLSWRALLVAVACLGLTVVGAQRQLAAPLVWGAVVGALLALWEVVPPALEASAWVVSGVAGAILLTLGASWDRRMRDARRVADYVRRLR